MHFVFNLTFVFENTSAKFSAGHTSFAGVASFFNAKENHVTVLDKTKFLNRASVCKAGACFVREHDAPSLPQTVVPLICDDPWREFVRLMQALVHKFPEDALQSGTHPSAQIHETVHLDPSCQIGPFVVIHAGVILGKECRIGAHSVIGSAVRVGNGCVIGSHVVLEQCTLGDDVHIQSGAKIGEAGFGFITTEEGPIDLPHFGKVCIGNNVRIGANTTIARGTLDDTIIQEGSRLDNLVQVAHNVILGKYVVLASQTGLSGSCQLDDRCMLGGQVGLSPGVHLGAGTSVAAKSGVMRASLPGTELAGIPAVPIVQWRRQVVNLWRMSSNNKKE